ncbi:hypothetical protein RFI_32104, partial [Reticulomyxa filosa]
MFSTNILKNKFTIDKLRKRTKKDRREKSSKKKKRMMDINTGSIYGFLTLLNKDGTPSQRIGLQQDEYIFGREESACDVIISQKNVSREHAKLWIDRKKSQIWISNISKQNKLLKNLDMVECGDKKSIVNNDNIDICGHCFVIESTKQKKKKKKKKGCGPKKQNNKKAMSTSSSNHESMSSDSNEKDIETPVVRLKKRSACNSTVKRNTTACEQRDWQDGLYCCCCCCCCFCFFEYLRF